MDPLKRRFLGKTGVQVTPLGLGAAQLGELYVKLSEGQAQQTLETAYDSGITYFDCAPWYGRGLSEHRVGHFLRSQPRPSFVLSTKVGRVFFRPPDPGQFDSGGWAGGLHFEHRFDYSYEGVMRSYEDSLQRLGMTQVDLLLVHDLDVSEHGSQEVVDSHFRQLAAGGWKALEELRSSGEIKGIGAGLNVIGMVARFLESFDMDFFLLAMPYTLLDQEALDDELPRCSERNAGVIIGAPYSSGILATGAVAGAHYRYEVASEEVLSKVRRIQTICNRHEVPLRAAALQFPLGHPSVASVIPGADTPDQVIDNLNQMRVAIPEDFWKELKSEGLLHRDAPVC